jgi:hypothetical protein
MYRSRNCTVTVIYPGEATFGFCYKLNPNDSHDQVLEQVYNNFNKASKDLSSVYSLKKRTLGINDIVRIEKTYYQRELNTWREVTEEYVVELEKKLTQRSYE